MFGDEKERFAHLVHTPHLGSQRQAGCKCGAGDEDEVNMGSDNGYEEDEGVIMIGKIHERR